MIKAIFKTLLSKKSNGEIINIGSGKPTQIKKMISLTCKIIGKGKPQFGKIKYKKDMNMRLYPNISKAKRILRWSPKTTLLKGLNLTINSYK